MKRFSEKKKEKKNCRAETKTEITSILVLFCCFAACKQKCINKYHITRAGRLLFVYYKPMTMFFSFIADAHLFYSFRRWIKLLPCCIINYKNKNIESFYFHPPIIISTLFQIPNVRLRLFATE